MANYIRIFVGLGGFGSSVVQNLYQIVKKENNGIIPDYIKFAAYDSATNEKPKHEDFPFAVDFMKASSDGPQEFLYDCRKKYKCFELFWPGLWSEKNEEKRWWTSDLIWSGRGLGQYRPFGRLGFMKHLTDQPDNVIELVKNEINEAAQSYKTSVNALTPRIVIVNSLAGGTGSSAFIDVASIIKDEIKETNDSLEIILFTVTGEASMKGRASEASESYKWALENSYAALTELDYWMNDGSTPLTVDYPRYGNIKGKIPVFRHVGLICEDNMSNKNLNSHKDYNEFLAELLNVIAVRVTSNTSFDTPFDNILGKFKRYGSYGLGSLHFKYKDALLYEYSLLVEEGLSNKILESNSEEVKVDIEKEIEKLHLYEEGYYTESVNTLNVTRKDSIFNLLENAYIDERGIEVRFPFISLAKLEAKITSDNVQIVLKSIKDLDNEIIQFLNIKKKETYEKVRSAIESHLFINSLQNRSVSYIKEYIIQLKMIVDARVKGLEKDIPEIFEKIHYKKCHTEFNDRAQYLEKKQNRKALDEFAQSYKKFYEIKKLVYKSKAKLEIYKNLSQQLEWYKKTAEEVIKPTEESIRKYYRSAREGLQIGTYDKQYVKDKFTVYVFPIDVKENLQKYKEIYSNFSTQHNTEKKTIINNLNDSLVRIIRDGTDNLPCLLDTYKTKPMWNDEISGQISNPNELNYDKRDNLKKDILGIFQREMNQDFKGYLSAHLPQNLLEALYFESQVVKCKFKSMLEKKLKDLDALVDPFVILGSSIDKNLEKRVPLTHLILSKNDFDGLFSKYGDQKEICKDVEEPRTLNESKKEIEEGILKDNKSLVEQQNLEKATLLKGISGFKLQEVSAYNNKFKRAYEKSPELESFADIRIKPGKSTREIVFLLAEYYNVIESKEPQFKFDGKTLETGLKGRANVIQWFIEERNADKIKQIKSKLSISWEQVAHANKKQEFQNVIGKLEEKKKRVKDDSLWNIFENNIKTMQHAVDFRIYETIHKELD